MTPVDRRRRRRSTPPPDAPRRGSVPDGYGDEIDWFAELRSPPPSPPHRDPGAPPGRRRLRETPPDAREAPRRGGAAPPHAQRRTDRERTDPPHRNRRDDTRVEMLPPGSAPPDDRPRRRRSAVIDGEVTGELPAVEDGEDYGGAPGDASAGRPPSDAAAGHPPSDGRTRRQKPPGGGGKQTRGPATRGARAPGRSARTRAPETPEGAAEHPDERRVGRASGQRTVTAAGWRTRVVRWLHRAQAALGDVWRYAPPWLLRELHKVERVRLVALICVAVLLIGSVPGFLLIKSVTRDPAFRAMDALELPAWAARDPVDRAAGSRWCIRTCRVRHRLWGSERALQPTVTAYHRALRDDNWKPWKVGNCPPREVRGNYACWRRDEYTLDLWVRSQACRGNDSEKPAARTGDGAENGSGRSAGAPCFRSLVTVVVRNAGADLRLR